MRELNFNAMIQESGTPTDRFIAQDLQLEGKSYTLGTSIRRLIGTSNLTVFSNGTEAILVVDPSGAVYKPRVNKSTGASYNRGTSFRSNHLTELLSANGLLDAGIWDLERVGFAEGNETIAWAVVPAGTSTVEDATFTAEDSSDETAYTPSDIIEETEASFAPSIPTQQDVDELEEETLTDEQTSY